MQQPRQWTDDRQTDRQRPRPCCLARSPGVLGVGCCVLRAARCRLPHSSRRPAETLHTQYTHCRHTHTPACRPYMSTHTRPRTPRRLLVRCLQPPASGTAAAAAAALSAGRPRRLVDSPDTVRWEMKSRPRRAPDHRLATPCRSPLAAALHRTANEKQTLRVPRYIHRGTPRRITGERGNLGRCWCPTVG